MAKLFNRAVQIAGENRTVGTPNVTVVEYDKDSNATRVYGATVPTDADAGYAPGCYFYKSTGGSVGAMVYINSINFGNKFNCFNYNVRIWHFWYFSG